jgi:hypothetical protein
MEIRFLSGTGRYNVGDSAGYLRIVGSHGLYCVTVVAVTLHIG